MILELNSQWRLICHEAKTSKQINDCLIFWGYPNFHFISDWNLLINNQIYYCIVSKYQVQDSWTKNPILTYYAFFKYHLRNTNVSL